MTKYVPDIVSKRWVIIAPQRVGRPDDSDHKKNKKCVFCPGNEKMTPPEVLRFGEGEKDKPGWKVRVVPNKFPITDLHEVIIHSTYCDKDLDTLPISQLQLIYKAYQQRYNFYRERGQVLIFYNYGKRAGASLNHPHSQLVVIPSQINLDALSREPLNNIVSENQFFRVYCPDFSQWPFEAWIAPKKEGTYFGDISDQEIEHLVEILQNILIRLKDIYSKHKFSDSPFSYNYYIYPKDNWYLRVIPRFIHRAGFELGTGLSVNIIDPVEASLEFRGLDEKTRSVLHRLRRKI